MVIDARLDEYARYRAVGKPLWSEAEGEHSLEPLDEGAATRLTFVETYHAFNPLRSLFEARVHRFISGHNGDTYERVLGHLRAVRKGGDAGVQSMRALDISSARRSSNVSKSICSS